MTPMAIPALAPLERPPEEELEEAEGTAVEEAAAAAPSMPVVVEEAVEWELCDEVSEDCESESFVGCAAVVAVLEVAGTEPVMVASAPYVFTAPAVLTSVKVPPLTTFWALEVS